MGSSATPLIALDAITIDTETTSVDARQAWIIEIGAIRLAGARLGASFQNRMRPPVPIPASSTQVHGIDDAAVAGAPPFAEVWPAFLDFAGTSVLIGHAIGFDLAVLKRECDRAGLAFTAPRTLDTRLLAELVAPNLAGHSLDSLASWLGVQAADRHTALGDAVSAARIFLALIPKLRERGIRTLAEAERACRGLQEPLTNQHLAGWLEAAPASRTVAPERVDSYPYIHRIADVMTAPAQFIAADATAGSALDRMSRDRFSSLFVLAEGTDVVRPGTTGIVTERDLLRGIAARGAAALSEPVERLASRPLACVAADSFAYLAMARMRRLNIRHLGVTDEQGAVIGALSARDLLRLRAESDLMLGDEIEQADDVASLAHGWAKLPWVAASLLGEGLPGLDIGRLTSRRVGELTQRAAALAEQRLRQAGWGDPPCPYAVAVLGSAGRGESLLAMDQDNALVFAEGAPDGAEDRWFAELAAHMNEILDDVGVPYCKGGVMAKTPQWRGSLTTWRNRIDDWIGRSNPIDLLSVDIFFDLRPVHGDASLADGIWRAAFEAAHGQASFVKLLTEAAGARDSGLNWFGGFKTAHGRIDLKKVGLFSVVTAARTLAIRHHIVERSTRARLAGIKALGRGGEVDLDALADAQATFLDLIVGQQIVDIEQGLPASNRLAVDRLARRDRQRLRAAIQAVGHVDQLTRDLLL